MNVRSAPFLGICATPLERASIKASRFGHNLESAMSLARELGIISSENAPTIHSSSRYISPESLHRTPLEKMDSPRNTHSSRLLLFGSAESNQKSDSFSYKLANDEKPWWDTGSYDDEPAVSPQMQLEDAFCARDPRESFRLNVGGTALNDIHTEATRFFAEIVWMPTPTEKQYNAGYYIFRLAEGQAIIRGVRHSAGDKIFLSPGENFRILDGSQYRETFILPDPFHIHHYPDPPIDQPTPSNTRRGKPTGQGMDDIFRKRGPHHQRIPLTPNKSLFHRINRTGDSGDPKKSITAQWLDILSTLDSAATVRFGGNSSSQIIIPTDQTTSFALRWGAQQRSRLGFTLYVRESDRIFLKNGDDLLPFTSGEKAFLPTGTTLVIKINDEFTELELISPTTAHAFKEEVLVALRQLNAHESTPFDRLKKLYKAAARKVHPDLTRSDNDEEFKNIQKAWGILKRYIGTS